jgi:inosose dehydratase
MLTRRSFLASALALSMIKKTKLKFGYSAITWNGNDLAAIGDISKLGFSGIQLRANSFAAFGESPADLLQTLSKNKLQLAMFSSGNVGLDTDISKDLATHLKHAKFIKALGGQRLQITNVSRPKNRLPTNEELVTFAKNLSTVAHIVKAETGIQPMYHNHMHQLGETPEEVDLIVNTMNTDDVKLLLDVAHYHQGGGQPAEAILKYKDILGATHIKDTRPHTSANGYQFCEIGSGKVDFPAVFENLNRINFKGWNIIELDAVPVTGRTPFESAKISTDYIKNTLKVKMI